MIAYFETNDHTPPDKLSPLFRGPYRVVNKYDSNKNVYTVQNILTNKLEDFHVTNLRPFIYDDDVIDPIDIAIQAQLLLELAK